MIYYSKCPVCGSKPSFSIRKKISLNKNSTIEKIEIEEFLIKVSKEKSPEEVLSVCMKCRLVYRKKFFDDKELEEIYNKAYYRMEGQAWIKGRWVEKKGERRRCYYTLTPEGKKVLARQRKEWQAFSAVVNLVIGLNHA